MRAWHMAERRPHRLYRFRTIFYPILLHSARAASSLLALIAGATLLFAGIAKLGMIADFLSKQVVTGFAFGLVINIVIRSE